jgi:hypothetical protein
VDIRAEVRIKIAEQMDQTEIPEDTFDEAYSTLLHDMYFNSFIRFRSTREFAESSANLV